MDDRKDGAGRLVPPGAICEPWSIEHCGQMVDGWRVFAGKGVGYGQDLNSAAKNAMFADTTVPRPFNELGYQDGANAPVAGACDICAEDVRQQSIVTMLRSIDKPFVMACLAELAQLHNYTVIDNAMQEQAAENIAKLTEMAKTQECITMTTTDGF